MLAVCRCAAARSAPSATVACSAHFPTTLLSCVLVFAGAVDHLPLGLRLWLALLTFDHVFYPTSLVLLFLQVRWITFHSGYDFGYLLKLLTCSSLPANEAEFFQLLKASPVFLLYFLHGAVHMHSACQLFATRPSSSSCSRLLTQHNTAASVFATDWECCSSTRPSFPSCSTQALFRSVQQPCAHRFDANSKHAMHTGGSKATCNQGSALPVAQGSLPPLLPCSSSSPRFSTSSI